MKVRAVTLALMVGLLILQPALTWIGFSPEAYGDCDIPEPIETCNKENSCTSTASCEQDTGEEKKGCEEKQCNPLLGCTAGNFYIHQFATINLVFPLIIKNKILVFDDNRLQDQMNECWHPPESIS
jgi:hypothetical protein